MPEGALAPVDNGAGDILVPHHDDELKDCCCDEPVEDCPDVPIVPDDVDDGEVARIGSDQLVDTKGRDHGDPRVCDGDESDDEEDDGGAGSGWEPIDLHLVSIADHKEDEPKDEQVGYRDAKASIDAAVEPVKNLHVEWFSHVADKKYE